MPLLLANTVISHFLVIVLGFKKGEKSSSRIKMPKHAYTNNNYCLQKREEAKQTNVKRETMYWATFQPFFRNRRWRRGGAPAYCSTGYYEPFVCLTSHFCNHVWADFSRGVKRQSLHAVSLRRQKNKKEKRKENNAFAKGEESKIKFRLFRFVCRSIICHTDAFN